MTPQAIPSPQVSVRLKAQPIAMPALHLTSSCRAAGMFSSRCQGRPSSAAGQPEQNVNEAQRVKRVVTGAVMAKSVRDLVASIMDPGEGGLPVIQVFPPLDVDQIARELRLDERAETAGRAGQPLPRRSGGAGPGRLGSAPYPWISSSRPRSSASSRA